MIYDKNLVHSTQFGKPGQYFRLLNATHPLEVTFIGHDGGEFKTPVPVGVQIPLERQYKRIYLHTNEPQNVSFWWGDTPLDMSISKDVGAQAIKASRVTAQNGETRLTSPNAVRKQLQISTNQKVFVGGLGDGENGWPLEPGEVLTLPLAGSLYAYKAPASFDDELLIPETFSKNFQNDPGQPGAVDGSFSSKQYFGVNRKIIHDAYTNNANFTEYNPSTDEFDITYDIDYSQSAGTTRTHFYISKYHNQLVYVATTNEGGKGIVIGEMNLNAAPGQNRIVHKLEVSDGVNVEHARVFKRKNGDYVIYSQYYLILVSLQKGTKTFVFNYNELEFGSFGFALDHMSEFGGTLYAYIKDGSKYKWSKFNEDKNLWEQAPGDYQLPQSSPDATATRADIDVFVTIDSNSDDLVAFVDGATNPVIVNNVTSASCGLDYIGGVVFITNPDTGAVYSIELASGTKKQLTADEGDNTRAFNHRNVLLDTNANKLVTTVNPSVPSTSEGGDVRIAQYPSPFNGDVSGAKVQLLEFIA